MCWEDFFWEEDVEPPELLDWRNRQFVKINKYTFGQAKALFQCQYAFCAPELDGALKVVVRKKIIHYRQLYLDRPEPIVFMLVAVDTQATFTFVFFVLLVQLILRGQWV